MVTVKDQNELALNFLLGKLAESEHESLEQKFFNDDTFFDELLIAENSLTDAFVTGHLSAEDQNRFKTRLQASDSRRESTRFARTLVGYASKTALQIPLTGANTNLFTRLARHFSGQPLLSFSSSAAAILLLVGFVIWVSNPLSKPKVEPDLAEAVTPISETPATTPAVTDAPAMAEPLKEVASSAKPSNREPEASVKEPKLSKAPVISTIILSLGATRGSGADNAVSIRKNSDQAQIVLKFDESDHRSYFAVVESVEGKQIWRGKVVRSKADKTGTSVSFRMGARSLSPGSYLIYLKGLNSSGTYEPVADYSLTISK